MNGKGIGCDADAVFSVVTRKLGYDAVSCPRPVWVGISTNANLMACNTSNIPRKNSFLPQIFPKTKQNLGF